MRAKEASWPRRNSPRKDEAQAEQLLAGAPARRVPEQEQETRENLSRPEAVVEAGRRLRRARRGSRGRSLTTREAAARRRGGHRRRTPRPASRDARGRRAERDGSRLEDAVGCARVSLVPSAAAFLRRFASAPAVELHLHLEGAIPAAALVRLSSRAPAPIFPDLASVRARRLGLGSPDAFFAFYRDVCRQLRSAERLRPRRPRPRGAPPPQSASATPRSTFPLLSPRGSASTGSTYARRSRRSLRGTKRRDTGGSSSSSTSSGIGDPTSAERVLDLHTQPPRGRVRWGSDSAARRPPSPRGDFADAFRRARRLGLMPVAHAGEWAGPDSVAETLERLRPVRLAHGIRAAEDAALLRALARRRVVCDVCPTSNLATGAVPRGAAHPVRALLAAGVPVTLSTDDPGLFGTTLRGEYRRVGGVGRDGRELAACARAPRVRPRRGPSRTGRRSARRSRPR